MASFSEIQIKLLHIRYQIAVNLKLAEGQNHLFMVCHLMGLIKNYLKMQSFSHHTYGKKNSNVFKRLCDSLTPPIMTILNYEKSIIYKSKQDVF